MWNQLLDGKMADWYASIPGGRLGVFLGGTLIAVLFILIYGLLKGRNTKGERIQDIRMSKVQLMKAAFLIQQRQAFKKHTVIGKLLSNKR